MIGFTQHDADILIRDTGRVFLNPLTGELPCLSDLGGSHSLRNFVTVFQGLFARRTPQSCGDCMEYIPHATDCALLAVIGPAVQRTAVNTVLDRFNYEVVRSHNANIFPFPIRLMTQRPCPEIVMQSLTAALSGCLWRKIQTLSMPSVSLMMAELSSASDRLLKPVTCRRQ